MTERTDLDLLRDLAEGRLAPADADALRARLAADETLRAEADRLAEVYALTAVVTDLPLTELTADDVLRAPPGRVLAMRRWAVAAVVVAAVGIGVAASLVRGPADVTLVALAPDTRAAAPGGAPAAPAGEVPSQLASYAPVRDGRPNWLASYDEAAALARESGKPLLVWVYHPTCPMCVELDERTFRDAGVRRDVEAFVPVRLDVMELDPESEMGKRAFAAFQRGEWPYIVAVEPDGATLGRIVSATQVDEVLPKLEVAARKAAEAPRATWEQVRAAATDLARAEGARRAQRLGEALTAARAADDVLPDAVAAPLAQRARAAAGSLAAEAQQALADAVATQDARAALPLLDGAARAFSGSPEGADLAAVADAVRATGRLPRLHARKESRP